MVFTYDAWRGNIHQIQSISTLPDGFGGANTAADVHILSSATFLYASNRGHDSIAIFSVNSRNGTLMQVDTVPTLGRTPRIFNIDSTERFLIVGNEDSGTLVVLAIDPLSGKLLPTGEAVSVPNPTCVLIRETAS
jgi:6-phosphogluconolactonase